MKYNEVKFLELPISARASSLQQMTAIHNQDEIYDEVENAGDFVNMIADNAYNPDKDFYFMLYDDGEVVVRSKNNF